MILKIAETLTTRFCVALITLYQLTFSLLLGPCCRFYPNCSKYALLCLDRYPLIKALGKIMTRITKCHPFHPGGEDLP